MVFAVVVSTPVSATDEKTRILFTNIHVFDGVNEARLENASVLVEGNLVKEVSTDTNYSDSLLR